jgi:hypothetical protein
MLRVVALKGAACRAILEVIERLALYAVGEIRGIGHVDSFQMEVSGSSVAAGMESINR